MKTINFKNTKLLGICLGMQLLLDNSYEFEKCEGLGLISGENIKLKNKGICDEKLNIPHINWRPIEKHLNDARQDKIIKNIDKKDEFYFIHSFNIRKIEDHATVSKTTYGEEFISFVEKNNIFGSQFHPEKSHFVGLKLLKNFLEIKN